MVTKLQYLQKYLAKPEEGGSVLKKAKKEKPQKKALSGHDTLCIRDLSETLPVPKKAKEERVKQGPVAVEDDIEMVDEKLVEEAQRVDVETSGVRWRIQQHRRRPGNLRQVKQEDSEGDGEKSDMSLPRKAPRGARDRASGGLAQSAGRSRTQPADAGSDLSPPRKPQPSMEEEAGGAAGSDLSPPRAGPSSRAKRQPQPSMEEEAAGRAGSDLSPPRVASARAVRRQPQPSMEDEAAGGAGSDLSPPRTGPAGPSKRPEKSQHLRRGDSTAHQRQQAEEREEDKARGRGADRGEVRRRQEAQNRNDSDLSPPRSRQPAGKADDLSPPRASRAPAQRSDSDLSPARGRPARGRKGDDAAAGKATAQVKAEPASDGDLSPPRAGPGPPKAAAARGGRAAARQRHDSDDEDLSPPRAQPQAQAEKMSSGLSAGLVQATQLREEATRVKEERRAEVDAAPAEQTGKGAGTVYRDKTGKKITREEWVEQRQVRKPKKLSEYPEQELEWGGGVKQRVRKEEEMAEVARIAAQPFARYEPDQKYMDELRERQDWNDPMRQHQAAEEARAEAAEAKKKSRPKCPHPPWPNRYNILPGYRWDGKVRGTGYEKRWLETRNRREFEKQEQWKNELDEM